MMDSSFIPRALGIAAGVAAGGAVALGLMKRAELAGPTDGLPVSEGKVCLVSCRELIDAGMGSSDVFGNTHTDEYALYEALRARGVAFDVKAWDDEVDWRQYSLIAVRTTWDYSVSEARAFEFRRWLNRAKADAPGSLLLNHARVISWNIHKGDYMGDLDAWEAEERARAAAAAGAPAAGSGPAGRWQFEAGRSPAAESVALRLLPSESRAPGSQPVCTIPTVIVPAGSDPHAVDLRAIMRARGWRNVLLKPAVGGGSRGCMRVLEAEGEAALEAGQAFLLKHVCGAAAEGGQSPRSPAVSRAARAAEAAEAAAAAAATGLDFSGATSQGGGPSHGGATARLTRSHSHHGLVSPSQAGASDAKAPAAPAPAAGAGVGPAGTLAPLSAAPLEKHDFHSGLPPHLVSPAALSAYADALADAAAAALKAGPRDAAAAISSAAQRRAPTPGAASTPFVSTLCDMLVQPYVASVETAGELSIVWVDGKVTHAVVKKPAPGSYRSQPEFGSTVTCAPVTREQEALAARLLGAAVRCTESLEPPLGPSSPAHFDSLLPRPLPPRPFLVGRLDFLQLTPDLARAFWGSVEGGAAAAGEASSLPFRSSGGEWRGPPLDTLPAPGDPFASLPSPSLPLLLLELEVIEPCLFLRKAEAAGIDAAGSLADAIVRRAAEAAKAAPAALAALPARGVAPGSPVAAPGSASEAAESARLQAAVIAAAGLGALLLLTSWHKAGK